MTVLIIIALAAIAAIVYFLTRSHGDNLPAGWTAVTAGNDYGAKIEVSGSFDFPQSPSSVHYVTKGCGSLANAKGITLRYTIEADPDTKFELMELVNGKETPVPNSVGVLPILYFQRAGDDWSGQGKFAGYRWWAAFNESAPIKPGDYELTATFDKTWNPVESGEGVDYPTLFKEALANAERVGFTFPGQTGLGHGCTAIGKARFILKSFEILENI